MNTYHLYRDTRLATGLWHRLCAIIIAALGLAMTAQPACADSNELILGDKDSINIVSKGTFTIDDIFSRFSRDSIVINKISLTYNNKGRKFDTLLVVSDNDTLLKLNAKNWLTQEEMAKNKVSLTLYANKNYTFSHGNQKWHLPSAGEEQSSNRLILGNDYIEIEGLGKACRDSLIVFQEGIAQPDSIVISKIDIGGNSSRNGKLLIVSLSDTVFNDAIDKNVNVILHTDRNYEFGYGDNNKTWQLRFVSESERSTPPCVIVGIVLGMGIVVSLVIIVIINIIKKKRGKKNEDKGKWDDGSDPNGTPTKNHEKGQSDVYELTEEGQFLLCMFPSCANPLGKPDLEEVRKQIGAMKTSDDTLEKIKRGLAMKESSSDDDVLNKIAGLMNPPKGGSSTEIGSNRSSTIFEAEKSKIKDEYAQNLLKKIKEKNELEKFVSQARSGSPQIILDEAIENISAFILKLTQSISTPQDKITSEQLKKSYSTNPYAFKQWLYDKLKGSGVEIKDLHEIFNEIAERIKAGDTAIGTTVNSDSFTDKQQDVMAKKLVERINKRIKDPASRLPVSGGMNALVTAIVELVGQSQKQPNSEDGGMPPKESDGSLQLEKLTKETGISAKDWQDAIGKIKQAIKAEDDAKGILNEYGAQNISELPEIIRGKQHSDIVKSNDSAIKALGLEELDTTDKLVKAIIDKAKESAAQAKKSEGEIKRLVGEIEKKITSRDSSYKTDSNKSASDLLNRYDGLVENKEIELKNEMQKKKKEIEKLNEEIKGKERNIKELEEKREDLMSATKKMTDRLHDGAERIGTAWKPILSPLSEDYVSQCEDIENRLSQNLTACIKKLKVFQCPEDTEPEEARRKIQQKLEDELTAKNSPIDTVARYYAYSLLPFMTDRERKYGIIFNRKNMMELYDAMAGLYVEFGISINVPPLFVMGCDEGHFEDVTGKEYGDLDNLCANSRNHYEKIDSQSKPDKVIVDIAAVGYTIDGETTKKPEVVTC